MAGGSPTSEVSIIYVGIYTIDSFFFYLKVYICTYMYISGLCEITG